ncbi:MAG: hypothetical protein ACOC06_07310 [Halorubrum sp.]
MTTPSPIPREAFESAVESLDSEAFAAFVGEAYAATADRVERSGQRITVVDGDRRTELLAVSTARGGAPAVDPDAVVVARDSLLDGRELAGGPSVVTPADLRQRLLYAASPEVANEIAERTLDVPMRSATYGDAPAADAVADVGGADEDDAAPGTATGASQFEPREATGATRSRTNPLGGAAADRQRGDVSGGCDASEARSRPPRSQTEATPSERNRPRTLVVAVVAVALLAAAAVGAATVSDGLVPGGENEPTDAEGPDPADTSPAESDADDQDAESDDDPAASGDGDTGGTEASSAGDPADGPDSEVDRNTAVAPTCERSALNVVQLQMNALRYNDEATNDGIRTARAFSSPTNRRAVGSIEQFISLFETPSYAPMLTYDTAQYAVPSIDNGTAEVEVVTRENGSVTGRYEFRLERVPGGSAGTDEDLGDADYCWMTRSVGATTE